MDSQFSDAFGVTTFGRRQKRRRSPDPELGLPLTKKDACNSGTTENIQRRKRSAKNMHSRERKCTEKGNAAPTKRHSSCGQREQFCEESKQRSASRNDPSIAGDNSSSTSVSREVPEESSYSGRYFLRKHKKVIQDRNSSLDLQAATQTATNLPKTVSPSNSKTPVSSNCVRTAQQEKVNDNSALSVQAQFCRCEESRRVASEGRILRSNVSGGAPLMTTEQASTSHSSDIEASQGSSTVTNEVGGSRTRSALRGRSSVRSNPPQSGLDTEAVLVETARFMHFSVLLSYTNTEGDASSTAWDSPRSIASLHDLLSNYLNLDASLNSHGLSTAQINVLPTRSYCKYGIDDPGKTFQTSECQICLCVYEQGVTLRKLPCFHEYHSSCIDRWLQMNRSCPICRSLVSVDTADQ